MAIKNSTEICNSIRDIQTEVAIVKHEMTCMLVDGPQTLGLEEMLCRIDNISACLDDLEDAVCEVCTPVQTQEFYPLPGTVFVSSSGITFPKIVDVKAKRRASVCGAVAFYDRQTGDATCFNWLDDVRAKKLLVLWCPSLGVVLDNETYLRHWEIL